LLVGGIKEKQPTFLKFHEAANINPEVVFYSKVL